MYTHAWTPTMLQLLLLVITSSFVDIFYFGSITFTNVFIKPDPFPSMSKSTFKRNIELRPFAYCGKRGKQQWRPQRPGGGS